MALKKGETYQCPDEDCGCEITVTKGSKPGGGGDELPRCCCGSEMEMAEERRHGRGESQTERRTPSR